MKIAIYIRTSTEEQDPDLQLRECESINKYGQATIFKDKQSAWKDHTEREEFEKLKKEIKAKGVEHMVVWDWDRIYRNRKRLREFFQLCSMFNCKIHSFRQQWYEQLNEMPKPFNEIMQDFFLNIMGWLAEDESDRKSQRVKLAVRKKGNKTISYKGNKWGRKNLSPQKITQLRSLSTQNKTIRAMASELGLSTGVVHKYLTKIKHEQSQNMDVHRVPNL